MSGIQIVVIINNCSLDATSLLSIIQHTATLYVHVRVRAGKRTHIYVSEQWESSIMDCWCWTRKWPLEIEL